MTTLFSAKGIRKAEQDGRYVLYNTLSSKCIRIDKKSYEIYKQIEVSSELPISSLKRSKVCEGVDEQELESFIKFMVEKGFINGN